MTRHTSPFASPEGGDPRREREGALPGAGILGMWIFLATLGVLFLASVAGWLYVRLEASTWPPPGTPALPKGLWLATLVILVCSATIHRASWNVRHGQTTATARWLWATLALGVVFLAIQTANWWDLVAANAGIRTRNLYAFSIYMLTGLHAAHVLGGLVLLVVVALRAAAGRYGSGHHPGVTYAAMYWHFLDAMWILVFLVLELTA